MHREIASTVKQRMPRLCSSIRGGLPQQEEVFKVMVSSPGGWSEVEWDKAVGPC